MLDTEPPELTVPTHAGAVVFRMKNRQAVFLLASEMESGPWSLPQEPIASDESAGQAAARGLVSAAGVRATILVSLGSYDEQRDGTQVLIEMFLARFEGQAASGGSLAKSRWAGFREALELLAVAEARACVRQAVRALLEMEAGD